MVSIFSTGQAKHLKVNSYNDQQLKNFDQSLNKVLLNLSKRVVADGESFKFITIKIYDAKAV